jgi:hypothetical protein
VVERLTYLSKLPKALLKPPKVVVKPAEDLVQIQAAASLHRGGAENAEETRRR